jgi:pimeloyl-ACP methyl ester carboxylesterase
LKSVIKAKRNNSLSFGGGYAMIFKKFGKEDLPVIILLHGGGLSYWSLNNIVETLINDYYVITPIIDGHGDDGESTFISIEDSANKLIQFIDDEYSGQVFAIGGLSIGAQIVVETLSKRENIAKYALVESALVYPIKGVSILTVPTYKLCYGLVKKRWFAKIQSKTLFVTDDMFEKYYEDSCKMSKQSLINVTLSNGNYKLKDSIKNTKAKVLIIVGEKELKIMLKSANQLNENIHNSELYIAKGMGHGEISLVHYEQFVKVVKKFIGKYENY